MTQAVRCLRGEPRLARALWWNDHADLAAEVSDATGLVIGPSAAADASSMRLVLTLDQNPASAYSLYAFRRLPWPATLATIEIAAR